MNGWVKISDVQGDLRYVNKRFVISVGPQDGKSFAKSGAEVVVVAGADTAHYFTAPGEATNQVMGSLGIE